MKFRPHVLFGLSVALLGLALAPATLALDTIYIVRHAEKDRNPWWDQPPLDRFRPLTETGQRRAALWMEHLRDKNIAAIYTSEATRTVHTGVPLAMDLGVPLLPGNGSVEEVNMAAFLRELTDEHREDKAVLVIGHSNTIPDLLKMLGAKKKCFERLGLIADGTLIQGNDGLWTIRLGDRGCKQMERETVNLPEVSNPTPSDPAPSDPAPSDPAPSDPAQEPPSRHRD